MTAIITGNRISPQNSANKDARPKYRKTNPRYIGLRVNRYGPETTSDVAGLIGTKLVRARRNKEMLQMLRITQMAMHRSAAKRLIVFGSIEIGKMFSSRRARTKLPA